MADEYEVEELDNTNEVKLTPEDELTQMLEEDESRLGDVYRLHVRDKLGPKEVADELNIDSLGFVWSYKSKIDSILNDHVPTNASFRKQAAGSLRTLMKKNQKSLSAEALAILDERLKVIEVAVLRDEQTSGNIVPESTPEFDLKMLEGKKGIYAFSYGWYLEHPVDENRGTTLIKVGRSEDIGKRIKTHRNSLKTHFPEPLVVVRAYTSETKSPKELEAAFHRLLMTAGHENPRKTNAKRSEVGEEWYLTNEEFLDAIASTLQLRTAYIGQSEFI